MKKKAIAFALLVFLELCSSPSATRNIPIWTQQDRFPDGKEWVYGKEFSCLTYIDVLSKFQENKCDLMYDIDEQAVGINFSDYIHSNRIFFADQPRNELLNLINKYFEWEETARKNKEEIDRKIGIIPSYIFWNIKNHEMYRSNIQDLTISFFSQSKDRHQLVLLFPSYTARTNNYITHKPDTLYLDKKHVLFLRENLKDNTVKTAIEKIFQDQNKEKSKYK